MLFRSQLKCVKAFYDITGELDEYKEKELSTFGNNMYMLFMSGIILGFLLSFMFNTDYVSVITFLVFCYSLYQQEQVIHRLELDIYEVSEDEVGEAKKKGRTNLPRKTSDFRRRSFSLRSRYLCRHSLFYILHRSFRYGFCAYTPKPAEFF